MARMIAEPTILIEENNNTVAMRLATTQAMSKPIISFVQLFWIGLFDAFRRTNEENNIKKIPTSMNGTVLFVLNKAAKISGITTSKIPVIPELIAFTSKTFFSFIIFEFCFNKGIFKLCFSCYLYTTTY